MRGALYVDPDGIESERIIPADAGSTTPTPLPAARAWDHPRGCGEHEESTVGMGLQAGSSPRMRGAPANPLEEAVELGIIPADAGSTSRWLHGLLIRKDHPRGCGEHLMVCGPIAFLSGSSPRMRGALSYLSGTIIQTQTDHPRGCGEHHTHTLIS